jgi:hypothetical protein
MRLGSEKYQSWKAFLDEATGVSSCADGGEPTSGPRPKLIQKVVGWSKRLSSWLDPRRAGFARPPLGSMQEPDRMATTQPTPPQAPCASRGKWPKVHGTSCRSFPALSRGNVGAFQLLRHANDPCALSHQPDQRHAEPTAGSPEGFNPGRGWADKAATNLSGWYSGMAYLLPIVGGIIADRFIGTHRSMLVGGVLIALGHVVLAVSGLGTMAQSDAGMSVFVFGLVLIIIGTGHFKPTISVMVGQLYEHGDARRDGAFSIFYMGINVGAMLQGFAGGVCGREDRLALRVWTRRHWDVCGVDAVSLHEAEVAPRHW